MSDQEPIPPQRISRREFLIHTRDVLKTAAATEILFRPLGLALEKSESGSLANRLGIADKLLREAETNPTEENKQLCFSWLKFNAAEAYMLTQGYDMTAATIRNFLYGKGTLLDVTNLYSQAILKDNSQGQGTQPDKETISNFITDRIKSATEDAYANNLMRYRVNIKNLPSEQSPHLKVAAVAYPGGVRDIETSLNRYTVMLDGEIDPAQTKTQVSPTMEGTSFTFSNCKFVIYDKYDWEKAHGAEDNSVNLKQVTEIMLSKLPWQPDLEKILGKDFINQLSDTKFEIKDWEGALLVEKGLAHNFEILGRFSTDNPITVTLPNEWLVK